MRRKGRSRSRSRSWSRSRSREDRHRSKDKARDRSWDRRDREHRDRRDSKDSDSKHRDSRDFRDRDRDKHRDKEHRRRGDDRRHSEDDDILSVRALVESRFGGGMIGRGGAVIKSLRENSGALVDISNSVQGALFRIMSIKGAHKAVAEAVTLIGVRIGELAQRDREEKMQGRRDSVSVPNVVVLLVPTEIVGALLGRQGRVINMIREKSEAFLKLSDRTMDNSSEKTLTVSASDVHKLRKACRMVCEQLSEAVQGQVGKGLMTSSQPYEPQPDQVAPHEQMGASGYATSSSVFVAPFPGALPPAVAFQGMFGAQFGFPPERSSEEAPRDSRKRRPSDEMEDHNRRPVKRLVEVVGQPRILSPPIKLQPERMGAQTIPPKAIIPLPEEVLPTIRGVDDQNINEIRKSSGAKITIPERVDGELDVMVTLAGSPTQMEKAITLIYAAVNSFEPKREPQKRAEMD